MKRSQSHLMLGSVIFMSILAGCGNENFVEVIPSEGNENSFADVAPGKSEILKSDPNSTSSNYCVEYIATDENGNSLQNFYAQNVFSYDEGKQLLSQLNSQFIEEAINSGSCVEQPTICPLTFAYMPVCGDIATNNDGPLTYDDICHFKVAVRQASATSTWNGSKGHFEKGACSKPVCFSYQAVENGAPINLYYAYNFTNYDEAKQYLNNLSGQFTNEDIKEGTCADQLTACAKIYMPVCGDILDDQDPPKTYGNVCEFRGAVIQAAEAQSKAHGSWIDGSCSITNP